MKPSPAALAAIARRASCHRHSLNRRAGLAGSLLDRSEFGGRATPGSKCFAPRNVFATELRDGVVGTHSGKAIWRASDAWGRKQGARGVFVREASTQESSSHATADGGEGQRPENEKKTAKGTEEEGEEMNGKTKTLRAALSHVPKLGWTQAAIAAGARDVGLSPAIAGAFPHKECALVEFFMDQCAQALVEEVESRAEELSKLSLQDRVATIVWMRVEMQIPYLSKWAQALSIQANPVNLPTTLKQRALLMDEIWHNAGDRSTDVNWYAKRAVLAGVYSATELYMLTDISPDFRESRAFLDRRISGALDCRKTVQEAGHFAQTLQAGLQNAFTSFLNRSRAGSGL